MALHTPRETVTRRSHNPPITQHVAQPSSDQTCFIFIPCGHLINHTQHGLGHTWRGQRSAFLLQRKTEGHWGQEKGAFPRDTGARRVTRTCRGSAELGGPGSAMPKGGGRWGKVAGPGSQWGTGTPRKRILWRPVLRGCRRETGLTGCGDTARETASKSPGPTGFLFSLPFLGLSPLPPIPLGRVRGQRETC